MVVWIMVVQREAKEKYHRLNWRVSCYGTNIVQKCTKWSQMRVHRLISGQIFAKFQCVSVFSRRGANLVKSKHKIVVRENEYLRKKKK